MSAFEQGMIAFHNGKHLDENPYHVIAEDTAHDEWENGWLSVAPSVDDGIG